MLNVVVLAGVLARPARDVALPSGARLLSLEITVRRDEGPAETVPVTWIDAPAWATSLDEGTAVVVSGRVRRRFFRAGGVTQSRTEVVAARVARAGSASRVRSMLDDAAAQLGSAAHSPPGLMFGRAERSGEAGRPGGP